MTRARRARTVLVLAAASVALVALSACSNLGPGGLVGGPAEEPGLGLVKDGTLTVATEGAHRPFSYHDEGTGDLVGYDIEVAEAVAEKLGLAIEFQEGQADAIFAGLEAGRVDLIANQVSIDEERQAKYLFSQPYTVSTGVIVVKDGSGITGFGDLAGKTTAQSPASDWYALAQEQGANVEDVDGWSQAVELLEQGSVDATIDDKLTFLDYVKTNGASGLAIAAETDRPSLSALAFAKSKAELVKRVGSALAELAEDGTLAALGEKYFGADVSK